MRIFGHDLTQTCGACPESYSVTKNGVHVGTLRLRHGVFTATDVNDDVVLTEYPEGDGVFEQNERIGFLTKGVESLCPKATHAVCDGIYVLVMREDGNVFVHMGEHGLENGPTARLIPQSQLDDVIATLTTPKVTRMHGDTGPYDVIHHEISTGLGDGLNEIRVIRVDFVGFNMSYESWLVHLRTGSDAERPFMRVVKDHVEIARLD